MHAHSSKVEYQKNDCFDEAVVFVFIIDELPASINAEGNSCTEGAIHGVSQFMPIGQFIARLCRAGNHNCTAVPCYRPYKKVMNYEMLRITMSLLFLGG